jgi:hypothetical protein
MLRSWKTKHYITRNEPRLKIFRVKNFQVKGQNDILKIKVFKLMLCYQVPKNILIFLMKS